MKYRIKKFNADLGFQVNEENIYKATVALNTFLATLPSTLYKNLDFKTTGALIGSIFCTKLVSEIRGAVVNPIEKGYPDIIPMSGLDASEEELRNYPEGLEIKGTVGNLKKGIKLSAGKMRVNHLGGITWEAHHREGKLLLGFIWDFVNQYDSFNYPAITAIYFTDKLNMDDWGEISGTTGRNTKVTNMVKSGKKKMLAGTILIVDDPDYIGRYTHFLG